MVIQNVNLVGAMLSYLMMLQNLTSSFIWSSTQAISSFNSIERLKEYADGEGLELERDWKLPEPPKDWPTEGNVFSSNFKINYRKGLPLVIDGMTFKVDAKQKVGIVGRTGSGKSTFLLCLMRILEVPEEHKEKSYIAIDGVRIDKIGLHHLRKAIEIIPQDPFLVEGTLRFNIDPFG